MRSVRQREEEAQRAQRAVSAPLLLTCMAASTKAHSSAVTSPDLSSCTGINSTFCWNNKWAGTLLLSMCPMHYQCISSIYVVAGSLSLAANHRPRATGSHSVSTLPHVSFLHGNPVMRITAQCTTASEDKLLCFLLLVLHEKLNLNHCVHLLPCYPVCHNYVFRPQLQISGTGPSDAPSYPLHTYIYFPGLLLRSTRSLLVTGKNTKKKTLSPPTL